MVAIALTRIRRVVTAAMASLALSMARWASPHRLAASASAEAAFLLLLLLKSVLAVTRE